ncbi:RICIN domain-containing protein, partial [Methylobacterium aquaticum]
GVPSPGVIVALGNGVAAPSQVSAPGVVTSAGGGQTGGGQTGGGTAGGGTGGGTGGGSGTLATGVSSFLKAAHSGLCLAIAAGDRSDGGAVTQQACTGAAEQTWTAQAGNGGTAYVNKASGKCLDMTLANNANPGSQVYQWTCVGARNQAWTQRSQNGGMAMVSVHNANLCVDIDGGSPQAGARTIAWTCHGGANQTFSVAPMGGASTLPAANGWWTPIGIAASRISIGADGTLVTLNADSKVPWRYVGDNNWTPLPGNFTDIAVISATSIYGIGTDTNVYRYNGQNWVMVGTNAKSIAAADGTVIIANGNNDIWLKQADDNTNAWRQLPGKALRVAVMNRNSLWHIGIDNNVYRGDQGGNWVAVGNSAAEIAASPDGSVVVTNTASQLMWRKTGDNTVGNWALVDPGFKATALTVPSAQRAIVVGLDRTIYRW